MRHRLSAGALLLVSACAGAEPHVDRPWFDTPEMAARLEAGAPCDVSYAPVGSIDAAAYVGPIVPKPICDGGPCKETRSCGSFRKESVDEP